MARGVNKVILIGNLGKDPEIRYTQSGTAVGSFSLATTERQKKNDEWIDHTEWHNIVVWGKLAENAEKFLKKGSTVYIEGRLQTRKWQDKDGRDRYTTEIVCQNMQFLNGGRDNKRSDGGSSPSGGNDNEDFPTGGDFDDIP